MFTFVTGGLRSGKSNYALRRASELGPPPWLYVAPHVEGDDDLEARLAHHRRDQDAIWRLKDAPDRLELALDDDIVCALGAMVLDRFRLWLSGRVAEAPANPGDVCLGGVHSPANGLAH